jgi:hypothetical protein
MNYVLDALSDLLIGGRGNRMTVSTFLDGPRVSNTAVFSGLFFFAHPANLPELSGYVHS